MVGNPLAFSSLVIVSTRHLLGGALIPAEGDTVLVVDADAVAAIREPLESVARWLCHVSDDVGTLQLVEKSARSGP